MEGNKHSYLEGSLIAWTSRKSSSVGPPYDFPSHGFWPCLQCQAWITSCGAGLNPVKRASGCPINSLDHFTSGLILPGRSAFIGAFKNQTFDDSSPSAAHIAPSENMLCWCAFVTPVWGAAAGGLLRVWGQPGLHFVFQSSLDHSIWLSQKSFFF